MFLYYEILHFQKLKLKTKFYFQKNLQTLVNALELALLGTSKTKPHLI